MQKLKVTRQCLCFFLDFLRFCCCLWEVSSHVTCEDFLELTQKRILIFLARLTLNAFSLTMWRGFQIPGFLWLSMVLSNSFCHSSNGPGIFFITELWPFLLGQTWLFLICSQVLEGFCLTGEPMYNFSTKMSSTWLKGTLHHRPVHSLLASRCNLHNEQIPVHLFVKTSVYLSLSLHHFVSAGVPNM